MVKSRGLISVVLLVIVLAAGNIFLFTNKTGPSYTSISGRLVEKIPELPLGINLSLVAFVAQWIILIAIIIFTYTRFLKRRNHEHVQLTYQQIKKMETRSRTDIDILYALLKKKKRLNTQTIAKVFHITKDKALEWGKILEDHELVTIEYPAFTDPEVRINGKEENEKEKKSDKQNAEKDDKEGRKKNKAKNGTNRKKRKRNEKTKHKKK